MATVRAFIIPGVSVFILLGCDTGIQISNPIDAPEITEFNISGNPENILSAVGRIRTNNAVSVRIEYGTDTSMNFRTPLRTVGNKAVRIPLLGLEPEKTYWAKPVAISQHGHERSGDSVTFTTGSLPSDMPRLVIHESDNPAPGYVMAGFTGAGAHAYGVIFNSVGDVLWYRRFEGSVIDFQKQPNGNYTACVARPGYATQFYEADILGTIVRSYQARENRETDVHELRIDGDAHVLFGIEYREMDLSEFGGLANAIVKGIVVEYYRPESVPLYWNTFDHFSVTDAADNISLLGQNVNPWHGNALEIDVDGNLLASFRHTEEVTQIDANSGNIVWRLGGENNEFEFVGDPFNGFSHQHGIRRLENRNIILFDNGNRRSPQESRAVEYHLDEQLKRATLVWEYRATPPLYSSALGFAQRLPGGHTFITYGRVPRLVEVDPFGRKRWEASVAEPVQFIYRSFKISSLY
ncbi:MAG: aryl-sulfate sulfotransferase [Bacteroidota bacterium]